MKAKWVGCHSDNFRFGRLVGGYQYRPSIIVVHLMDGSLSGTDAWFGQSLSGRRRMQPQAAASSSHYGISQGGEVHQYVKEEDTAYHAGVVYLPTWKGLRPGASPNSYTIGVEHEGRPDDAWTDAMYLASGALLLEICLRWGIVASAGTIIRHSTINAKHGQCPGPHCDMERLIGMAAAG